MIHTDTHTPQAHDSETGIENIYVVLMIIIKQIKFLQSYLLIIYLLADKRKNRLEAVKWQRYIICVQSLLLVPSCSHLTQFAVACERQIGIDEEATHSEAVVEPIAQRPLTLHA